MSFRQLLSCDVFGSLKLPFAVYGLRSEGAFSWASLAFRQGALLSQSVCYPAAGGDIFRHWSFLQPWGRCLIIYPFTSRKQPGNAWATLQALFVEGQRMLSFHCVGFLKTPLYLRGKTVHYLGTEVLRNKAYLFEAG